MLSYPQPGEITICEINRQFVTAREFSDVQSKDAYGEILGTVFSSVPFDPGFLSPNHDQAMEQEVPEAATNLGLSSLTDINAGSFKKLLFSSDNLKLPAQPSTQKISWFPHKHCLAFISGPNQVTVRDYEDSDRKDVCILTSDCQRDVKCIEWRPNSGKMVAVGCKRGIYIWSASYPANTATVRHGNAPSIGTFSRGAGMKMILVDVLKENDHNQEAEWDPEGRFILIAFSNSTTLGSIHFTSKPPSLDAQLLPVELPELSSLIGSGGIEKMAWDSSGERLALSYKYGDDKYAGLIAVYDVRRAPIVSVSLIGFIRGPGESAKPLELAFHNKFKQGPLLSVCWSSGLCCTYPLILRSHVVPTH
ncbi:hypothetical protein LUZ63_013182 [Rhynchospora breviuscula]|uniref:Uncharacterized protein n=1 Tax=Rhynchospora breviuscula TaxID=2022672 RepID=A0A9Q0C828_9POAL|nr:hypothetical protein LUZ63_013182 [Rhynchospora breviuscula]